MVSQLCDHMVSAPNNENLMNYFYYLLTENNNFTKYLDCTLLLINIFFFFIFNELFSDFLNLDLNNPPF